MRRTIIPMVWVTCVLVASALVVEANGKKFRPTDRDIASMPKIVNRVVDLLDTEVVLDVATEDLVWESARFETSQFNKIGLRFSAETESSFVTCAVCWQFAHDDEYLEGVPLVTQPWPRVLFQVTPGDLGRLPIELPVSDPDGELQRPDGVPDIYDPRVRQTYPIGVRYPYAVDYTEVRGLAAKVRCRMNTFVWIGDDPSDDQEPVPQTATLSDVKVLLRRE